MVKETASGISLCDIQQPETEETVHDPSETISGTGKKKKIQDAMEKAFEKIYTDIRDKGYKKRTFSLGVLNSLFLAWAFGRIPEHMWLIYMCEVSVLFPWRFYNTIKAKPLKQIYYWFDFCWVINIAWFLYLLVSAVDGAYGGEILSKRIREVGFATAWGIFCGPLQMAAIVLQNGMVFHDENQTVTLLIHVFPSLVMYTFRWKAREVLERWPEAFALTDYENISVWSGIYGNAAIGYAAWWCLFALWLMTCGLKKPAKKCDTIFHSMIRGGESHPITIGIGKITGKKVEEIVKSAGDTTGEGCTIGPIEALLYMFGHATMICVGIFVAIPCFLSRFFMDILLAVVIGSVIILGSRKHIDYMPLKFKKEMVGSDHIPRWLEDLDLDK